MSVPSERVMSAFESPCFRRVSISCEAGVVWPVGAGAGAHGFDVDLVVAIECLAAESSEYDSLVVDDDCCVEVAVADACAGVLESFLEVGGGDVCAGRCRSGGF